uniref:Heme-binding protein soul5, like n=1 Tax=Sinocyclocheilus rhinocerous TaxID=307959 RepID=A0A673N0U9_9TELE
SSSSFCSESRECLQFDLLCRTDEYEVRRSSCVYASIITSLEPMKRVSEFLNCPKCVCVCAGVRFEMTAPVLVEVPEEVKMWEPAIYTLSFLLPSAYQEHPPTPTNDKLYFSDMPDMDVYVRSYGGWMLSITSRLHAHLLSRALLRAHAHFNHTHHYTVGYDSPLKLLNRHNEVWYVVEGDPVCGEEHTPDTH